MQVEVKEIQRRLGVTTIFVTHDQSEALSLSDRIAVMSGGRICQIDTPEQLYRKPADRFVASFIGEGSLLKAKLDRLEGDQRQVSVGSAALTRAGRAAEPASRPARRSTCSSGPSICICRIRTRAAFKAIVAASIYQGDHVDLYIDVPQAAIGRIHMRLGAREAAGIAANGSKIAIGIDSEDLVAFPEEPERLGVTRLQKLGALPGARARDS